MDRPLQLVEFESLAIGRITKYMVMLPADYETSGKSYPVLYLLHGFSQNYTVWPIMGLAQHVGGRDLIVVMPDGGNSWFINWAESFDGQLNNWEDFIVYDLIHSVDQTFRTVPAREGRAISGVSMGGFGALTIGLRHPDMFCSIGSQSGALDFARSARMRLEAGEAPQPNVAPPPRDDDRDSDVPELIQIPGFTMQHERYPNGIAFKTADDTNEYDPFDLIQQIPVKFLPHIYLDCGLDDGLLNASQELAALMMTNHVPFVYAQTPGAHGANYWARELATAIAVQYTVLDRNVKAWMVRSAAEQLSVVDAAAAPGGQEVQEGEQPPAPGTSPH
jgi:S-formylglutathione hydrolase FrmB